MRKGLISVFGTVLLSLMLTVPMQGNAAVNGMDNISAVQQTRTIKGHIADDAGEPVIGASILEKGTTNGTITDLDGNFQLKVGNDAILVISYIGYQTQELAATDNMNIVLHEETSVLNEVVVVGYGSMRRKDVTSAITTIQRDELNQGVFSDPASMLQGKVAGLTITSTGDPTSTGSITLRGASSLRQGAAMEPYYVIDGIPGVDISMVAPDDIESIDVLRDATATAIYGSKAANGVIIITTKSGKEGRTSVSYNAYVAIDNALKTLDMATASQLRSSGELVEDEGANTDWQKEVLRTGFSHNHNLAISGGTQKTKYNASINYMNRDGVIRGTDMNRVNARALVTTDVLKDRLSLSVGVNAMQSKDHNVPRGFDGASVLDAMNYFSPTNPVRNADGSWFRSYIGSQNYNPMAMIYEDNNDTVTKRLQFIGKASLKIVDGLVWNANYSYNAHQYNYSYYNSQKSQLVEGYDGKAYRQTRSGEDKTFETYANFDKTFNMAHRLGLMAGYSWEERMSDDGFGVAVYDFFDDYLRYNNMGFAHHMSDKGGMNADVDGGNKTTIRNISFYGRLNYSYNGKYMLQATVRRDGSSVFGKNHRWGTFPSVSVAWNIAEEDFMKSSVFNQLKLRAGYGISGNALGFDAYTAISTYVLDKSGSFDYINSNGTVSKYYKINVAKNANPDLKWESTGMLNIGLDFALLHSRLSGSIEVYHKKTKDLIWDYPVSTNIYPVGSMTANVGNITNTGIEFTLNAVPVQTNDFTWQSTLNLSHNKNKVDKLTNSTYSVPYIDWGEPHIAGISANGAVERILEGESLGTFWTYEWAGYDGDGNSLFYVHDAETGKRTGETTTEPQVKDKTKVGCAMPKLTYGWNNNLTYKNWSLTAFFQGMLGNKIMNATRAHYSSSSLLSGGKNVLAEALNDSHFKSDPRYNYPSDRYLENGDFLRLKTLTIGYTFKNLNEWAQSLQVYATANNLLTLTGYKGLDPEVYLGGLQPGLDVRETFYPQTRSFMFGVKVNF